MESNYWLFEKQHLSWTCVVSPCPRKLFKMASVKVYLLLLEKLNEKKVTKLRYINVKE